MKVFHLQIIVLLLSIQSMTSCRDTSFNSANRAKKQEPATSTPSTAAENPPAPNTAVIPPRDCPDQSQKILILDMKSGWWSGDAGTFINQVINGLLEPCAGKIEVEYHHLLQNSNVGSTFPSAQGSSVAGFQQFGMNSLADAFAEKDWSKFHQIWILSGSSEDTSDMKISHKLYQQILPAIVNSKANILIGSGNGNLTHANNVATALLGQSAFKEVVKNTGTVVNASQVITTVSISDQSKFADHAIFKGRVVGSITDQVMVDMMSVTMTSDTVIYPQAKEILKSNDGRLTMAEVISAARKIILDSGLQRYYGIKDTKNPEVAKNTLKFLQNTVNYLAL